MSEGALPTWGAPPAEDGPHRLDRSPSVPEGAMRLVVTTPVAVVVREIVTGIVAEAENGSFGLRPHHIDFVAALAPGLLSYRAASGGDDEPEERYLAVDGGTLVKVGREVSVATYRVVAGERLGRLNRRLAREALEQEREETRARSAIARLEAGFVRHLGELQEQRHGR